MKAKKSKVWKFFKPNKRKIGLFIIWAILLIIVAINGFVDEKYSLCSREPCHTSPDIYFLFYSFVELLIWYVIICTYVFMKDKYFKSGDKNQA